MRVPNLQKCIFICVSRIDFYVNRVNRVDRVDQVDQVDIDASYANCDGKCDEKF